MFEYIFSGQSHVSNISQEPHRAWHMGNYELTGKRLLEIDWDLEQAYLSANQSFDMLSAILSQLVNMFVPQKPSQKQELRLPWATTPPPPPPQVIDWTLSKGLEWLQSSETASWETLFWGSFCLRSQSQYFPNWISNLRTSQYKPRALMNPDFSMTQKGTQNSSTSTSEGRKWAVQLLVLWS